MTPIKRIFDIILALILAIFLLAPSLIIAIWLLINDGRPVFYLSQRMRGPDQPFWLWKFRTMKLDPADSGVSGGDKRGRITRTGRTLRKYRLDEIPQLWNILKGDMSFVGPRPPLPRYVEMFPKLYAEVLRSRPGMTGVATLYFRRHEERLLVACTSAEETEATYTRRCIPRKARLDMIYQRRRNLSFDVNVIWHTVSQVLLRR